MNPLSWEHQCGESILMGSTKFRTDEKGHELKAHDSFFLK